jgi:two-component system nitrogen regulation response regulator GlnG/two-component system response regulator HydG
MNRPGDGEGAGAPEAARVRVAHGKQAPPMTDDRSTIDGTREGLAAAAQRPAAPVLALVVAWSRQEPQRAGEIAIIDGEQILGRGGARPEDTVTRVRFQRQRPGGTTMTGPLDSLRISRAQLRVRPRAGVLEVESIGRCRLLRNGDPLERGEARPGDTLQLEGELVFLVTRRLERLPALRSHALDGEHSFGAADPSGFVGETLAAWELRDTLAFVARADGHVLIRGQSGTGKELAAGAVHRLSARGSRPLVARNAATFPAGLVDAELFGNVRNYPNPGTAEREGIIGEADGTSLFLDEIGELPPELQAHLLRVLDRRGEYQRLGEARVRRSDLRVIAATNRRIEDLKHDFAARFTLRVEVPSLEARRDDIPLLIRHLLRRAAAGNEDVRRRFFDAPGPGRAEPEARIAAGLIDALVRHAFPGNTRELEQLLWQALAESRGETVELTEGVKRRLVTEEPGVALAEIGREQIEASLARAQGNVTRAARELGLKNRFVLYRLMKKLGVAGGASEGEGDEQG